MDKQRAQLTPRPPVDDRLRTDCVRLTAHAVGVRYPDVPMLMSEKLGREAAKMSQAICGAIQQQLAVT